MSGLKTRDFEGERLVGSDQLLPIETVCRRLAMSRQAVTQAAKRGDLRRQPLAGGLWGYLAADVSALGERRRAAGLRPHCLTCACPGRVRKQRPVYRDARLAGLAEATG